MAPVAPIETQSIVKNIEFLAKNGLMLLPALLPWTPVTPLSHHNQLSHHSSWDFQKIAPVAPIKTQSIVKNIEFLTKNDLILLPSLLP